jgi:dTDP-4-dehydrorhamnose 3,5-epimerase
MQIIPTPIADLYVFEPKIWTDSRGYFFESFNQKYFDQIGVSLSFVQDNQSLSHKGTLRGLHAQAPPFAQGKLVRVIQGSVLDVAVDIRTHSDTYGQHFCIELSGENQKQLWVPPGFLHGFVTLRDDTIFTYKVTNYYDRASEIGVLWNDNSLSIDWLKYVKPEEILLSEKDEQLGTFSQIKSPF